MTRSASGLVKPPRREPMRIVSRVHRPDPAKIEEILDLKALKDAPPVKEVRGAECLVPSALQVHPEKAKAPGKTAAPEVAPEILPTQFAVRPVGMDVPKPMIPMVRIETPKMEQTAISAPEFSVSMPAVAKTVVVPAAADVSAPMVGTFRLDARRKAEDVKFVPAEKVYEKVDEKVVAEEKAAVKGLMDVDKAADLQKFVNVTMTAAESEGWRY